MSRLDTIGSTGLKKREKGSGRNLGQQVESKSFLFWRGVDNNKKVDLEERLILYF